MSVNEAYFKLAQLAGYPNSQPFLKIIEKLLTPDEARLIVELPASNADLVAKLNQDEKTIENSVQDLWRKGHISKSKFGYRFHLFLEKWRDLAFRNEPELIPPGLDQLWMDFYESGWWQEMAMLPLAMGDIPFVRVIPAQQSIQSVAEVLPIERVQSIIEEHELVLVSNCPCRSCFKKCDHPVFTCIFFDARAEEMLSRGSRGRKVSADEAVAIALSAEESGLVPQVYNSTTTDYICHCCTCCCVVLNPLNRAGKVAEGIAKSRFVARIDKETCSGCQLCMDRCPFGAIDMVKFPEFKKLKAVIDPEKCFGCGLCSIKCETESITLESVRSPEHIPSMQIPALF
ncbi:ATP-binding protein [Chloroflexota bacterium]